MKFLNINATISVKPQFSGEVLKAGTPLDISGNEANSDAAVGIVASDTAVGAESIAIVTEGTIDLTEVAASYGEALTDDCIAALKGITFLYGGKAVVPSAGGGLPDYSEARGGDALIISGGEPVWGGPKGGELVSLENALGALWSAAYSAAETAENGETTLATYIVGDPAEAAKGLIAFAQSTMIDEVRLLLLNGLTNTLDSNAGMVTSIGPAVFSCRYTFFEGAVDSLGETLSAAAIIDTDVTVHDFTDGVAAAIRVKITPAAIV